MDVAYFLFERLKFIRQFYLNCSGPFLKTKSQIENEEEPFVPPYSEDGEPPFMAEWQEAEDSLQVLGYTCLSMLSNSLKLYFTRTEQEYGFRASDEFRSVFKSKGFLAGYEAFFKTDCSLTSDPPRVIWRFWKKLSCFATRLSIPHRFFYIKSRILLLRRRRKACSSVTRTSATLGKK